MKKIVIIGAGIAGLTAGVYARLSGFDTHIYEKNASPGGECTGWKRDGYLFDGCVHWLVGSKKGTGMNRIWYHTGALDDNVKILDYESFVVCERDGVRVQMFTDTDRLEAHLLDISPDDSRQIKRFCRHIRAMKGFSLPVDMPMDMMSAAEGIGYALRNLKKLVIMMKYRRLTMPQFAAKFKHPAIRQAILSMMVPGCLSCVALLFTLASMGSGDSGFPYGGSADFAERMAATFESYGGAIHYGSGVAKVAEEDGKATGILLENGKEISADYVVSCADGYETLYKLLGGRHVPKAMERLYMNPDEYPAPTCSLVYFGINDTIPDAPHVLSVSLKKPQMIGSRQRDYVQIVNYDGKGSMAPEGKTVFCFFLEEDFEHWQKLYADKQAYRQAKEALKEKCSDILFKRYPQLEGKIEASDVVTPMTYVKYCNAWKGSWMSWGHGRAVYDYHSGQLPGLGNFLMAGIWTFPPGGLPCAAASGKFAVQRICAKEKMEFCGD